MAAFDESNSEPENEEQKAPLFTGDSSGANYDDTLQRSLPSKSQNPDELAQAEGAASSGAGTAVGSAEQGLMAGSGKLGDGLFNEAAATLGPGGAIIGAIASRITRKRAAAGGGIAATILTVMIIGVFSASLEFVHLRENMLDQGNKLVNYSLQQRRVVTFKRIARQLHQGTLQSKLTKGPSRLQAKLEKQGFKTVLDKDGKLQKLSYTSERTGETRTIDYGKGDLKGQTKNFYGNGGFGREASRKLDLAVGSKAASWKGAASRKLYSRLNVRFNNWLDRKSNQKNDRDKLASNLQAQEKEQNRPATHTKNTDDPRDKNQDGTVDPNQKVDDSLHGAADTSPSDLQHDTPSPVDINQAGGAIGDVVSGRSVAGAVVKGLNVTSSLQTACSVARSVELVRQLRNMSIATQLVRFTFNFLTVADGQKAGVISGDGMKLMALYMNTENPKNGKSALSSGGIQGTVFGKSGQHASNENLAKYSLSHKPSGWLASAQAISDKLGLAKGDAKKCHFVDNGLVQIGGFAVGIFATVFTGGGFDAANAATNVGIAAAGFVASYYAKQLLVKSATGVLLTGYENGDEVGDALAGGWGASRGMTANINGLRPVTKKAGAKLAVAAKQDLKDTMGTESIYARYIDTNNVNSLVSRMAVAFPSSMSVTSILASIPHFFGSLVSNIGSLINARGFAATENTASLCTDNQPTQNDIMVDDFCNPEMASYPNVDIEETEQVLLSHTIKWFSTNPVTGVCNIEHTEPAPLIDTDGAPISYPDGEMKCDDPTIHMNDDILDYASVVQTDDAYPKPECLSGRLGIMYAPYKEGKDIDNPAKIKVHEPNATIENVCFTDGPPLSNDAAGVGRFIRYTAWYGYMVDEQNFIEQVNENYTGTAGQSGFLTSPWNNLVMRKLDALA